MRKTMKYTLCTLGIIVLLVMVSISLIIIFVPKAPLDKAEGIINQKLGFSTVDNIDIISDKIIPLSYDLIIGKYPALKDEINPDWHVLTKEQYEPVIKKLNNEFFLKKENEIARAYKEISSIDKLIMENDNLLVTRAADYRDNCINQVNYNNCPEMLLVHEKNKIDVPKTKTEALSAKATWLNYVSEIKKVIESEKNKPVDAEAQDAVTFHPNVIYLKYIGNQRTPAQYLTHAIHESFHALSTNPSIELPAMWEEGFTDFFTLQVINEYVGFATDEFLAAFPLQVKLVRYLLPFIPEQELLTIYTTKNELLLKKKINEQLGAGSYDKILFGMNSIFNNVSYSGGFKSSPEIDGKFAEIEHLFNTK